MIKEWYKVETKMSLQSSRVKQIENQNNDNHILEQDSPTST